MRENNKAASMLAYTGALFTTTFLANNKGKTIAAGQGKIAVAGTKPCSRYFV